MANVIGKSESYLKSQIKFYEKALANRGPYDNRSDEYLKGMIAQYTKELNHYYYLRDEHIAYPVVKEFFNKWRKHLKDETIRQLVEYDDAYQNMMNLVGKHFVSKYIENHPENSVLDRHYMRKSKQKIDCIITSKYGLRWKYASKWEGSVTKKFLNALERDLFYSSYQKYDEMIEKIEGMAGKIKEADFYIDTWGELHGIAYGEKCSVVIDTEDAMSDTTMCRKFTISVHKIKM